MCGEGILDLARPSGTGEKGGGRYETPVRVNRKCAGDRWRIAGKRLWGYLAVHAAVYNHFNTQRHLVSRKWHRLVRLAAIASWRHVALPA